MNHSMLIWTIRALFLLILAGAAAKITNQFAGLLPIRGGSPEILLFVGILGIGVVAVIIDVASPNKRIGVISAVYFGLMVGSLLGHLLSLAFGPTLSLWTADLHGPFTMVTTTILCYLCVSVILQTKDDFRFIIPYVEFSPQRKGIHPLIADAGVIIDGRIADIADTGLIDDPLVIPRFVLQELQTIAESPEKLRRNRGRRGLDILDRLQKCERIDVEIRDVASEDADLDCDSRLIALAQSLGGKLITNDENLAKMAKIQNVESINIHAVSAAVRPPVLHGESLSVRLVKEGEGPGQGIGYLEDGTMVVAEMGKNFVGAEVNLVVTSVLQTSAGRMVFGRIDSKNPEPARVGR